MIEIITERKKWNQFMKLVGHFDFYYTYYYHLLSKKEEEKPVLIAYRGNNSLVALPLLVRDIEGTEYRDATSVYGYAGPLCKTKDGNPLHFDNTRFKEVLQGFLYENKIVSVFTRLHPYLDYQKNLIDGLGCVNSPGDVVNIDLTLPIDIQRRQYNNRLKTYVNKARRKYDIVEGKNEEQIEEFIDMYFANMRRVDADDYYFFDKRYFYQLMISSYFKVELLMCSVKDTGELVGGAMFIKTGNIVQYHLSGCKEEYLHLNPIKLLIDEMRLRATAEGFTYFNLGGGLGVREDSLFHFKASFSKDLKPAEFWKYIVNENAYDELVVQMNDGLERSAHGETDYFPAYRQQIKTAQV
ncbi:GNAT family N-acetyltransferase [Pricia sp. S334]|uniref:GNAT family N-acetyltransferase n=1 Tax=Pricia mediterranea TaxID=3076079 RepID=A0ABU3L9W8_9FLAO|nr:GNAT family N-acetyltransferase [Pricia sp. S334]MDT7830188.1 GNAT family N-acetyltransferase [Pricia sp. S334]